MFDRTRDLTFCLHARRTCILALVATAAACSPPVQPTPDVVDSSSITDAAGDVTMDGAPADASDDAATDVATDVRTAPNPEDCDPLDEGHCAFPWPSNLYLRPDMARPTGYTLTFGPTSLPRAANNLRVDPTAWRRFDGYSVGEAAMTFQPDLDPAGLPTEYNLAPSMADDARILYFEVQGAAGAQTLRRIPYYAELDSQEPDPTKKILFIRPAVLLKEGTRYVIALRNLRNRGGAPIAPSAAFRALRDRTAMTDPALAPRVARFEEMFTLLTAAGVARDSLTLAWDFNTASSRSTHGPLLHMTRDVLQRVPEGPAFEDVRVTEYSMTENADIALEIRATINVPHYMIERSIRGIQWFIFNNGPDGLPMANGTLPVDVWIRVPRSAVRSATNPNPEPHGLVQYGHGLMGSGDEVRAGYNNVIANNNRLIFFSANLAGMSFEDFVTVGQVLRDFSRFPFISDRLHQGMVNWVALARAMIRRFPMLSEVTSRGIRVNTDERFYSGISQGGIFGGTYMAISPDITRGHLGVPGNNYGTLLHRSKDFDQYFTTLRMAYADERDQAVLLSLSELLWSQVDPMSYYRHVQAEPFAGLPTHYVLLAPAKGDHQVAVHTNEIPARSAIEIPLMLPYEHPMNAMARTMPEFAQTAMYPRRGSAVVLWDLGNPWQDPGNRTVSLADRERFPDPHGRTRQLHMWHSRQMVHFFRGRPMNEAPEIIDVCNGQACAFTNCFGSASACTPRF
ncbi:MAG: hypothetical protein JNK05_18050 [Myxococcales bacterium]|nr:hypothetical protein [Myxococcales bacterium]